ncbi:uncharacterized protein CMU_008240 [Cryptosporidium muris RN66]|uniref:Signal recognition particle receptor subunit beta n=1 Tax=Cryptosporidium muris (strain RN66) TaxID=441375 RepID=B6ADP2_CRYMR|nr:uncharacterized protein CMU_008240 [Cryptosporidium muris RN66]EEA06333.1 hypothetical protein, conserved [Cryptosporidium muris RN66]|eukprot:XP_002140682.1 hypothetical protein [Cryptosporidium muris RN66]
MIWIIFTYFFIIVLSLSLLYSSRVFQFGLLLLRFVSNNISKTISNSRSKEKAIIILGPSGSGKTTFFYMIKNRKFQHTTISMKSNVMELNYPENTLLIDIPGNTRIAKNEILRYIPITKAIIMMIDSTSKSSFRECAELLYFVICEVIAKSISYSRDTHKKIKGTPIFIICNKNDLSSSRNESYIKEEIERTIDRIRNSQSLLVERNTLGDLDNPFNFDDLPNIKVSIFKTSLLEYNEDVIMAIQKCLNFN